MKRAAFGLCMATAFAASLAAQAQQPPATTPQPASPAQTTAAAPGEMNLTGCLAKGADGGFTLTNVQQASATASGGSGAAPAGAGATSTPSPSGAGAAGGPSAAAGASSSGASASASAGPSATWMLRGGDLAAHVGHRITVTGKAAPSSASGATSTTGAAGAAGATTDPAASRPAATSGTSSARTLEVSSVKMVSATCQ